MKYVLVSLVGDSATEISDDFARYFAKYHPPGKQFHESSPSHEEVAKAIRETPLALVFGHDGGESLRASSNGLPWANPTQFAKMFSGARVWVYACNTRAPKLKDDLNSFGRQVHEKGVTVFAGHCAAIGAPPSLPGYGHKDYLRKGLARALRAFLQGENNAKELKNRAIAGSGRGVILGARWLEEDMKSLRILK